MSAERKPDLHLEIAHVLFIDVVGYSKLLADEQSETLQLLNQIVRGTAELRTADEKGELIRLPTGDGMALVFLTKPEAPVQCAMEISKAIKSYPELRLRMGIHSGSVNQMRDVNDRLNVTGAGINTAQRVMDCGDAGHILLSRRVAEDLEQYRLWQPRLHDLGECEVKHGVRVHVFNLYTDEIGNRDVPAKLKPIAQEPAAAVVTSAGESARSKHRLIAATVLLMIALALGFVFWVVSHRAAPKSTSTSPKRSPSLPAPVEIGNPLDLPALAQKARGAVVLIVGYDAAGKMITGSGFFVSADGRLVTNYHVIEGIVNAQAKLESGAIYNIAGVLASSSTLDLAVLKADARDMQFLLVDDASNPPQPGTRIAVIGSPLALEGSLSEGIVSAIRSRLDGSWLLQVSAPISPGSSGSPVLDRHGRVVGVATLTAEEGQNLNFASSSHDLWNFLQTIDQDTKPKALSEKKDQILSDPDFIAAREANDRGDGAAALKLLNTRQQRYRNEPRLLFQFAYAYETLGLHDEAYRSWRAYIDIDPTDPAVWRHFAIAAANLNRISEAINAYKQTLKMKPDADTWRLLGDLYDTQGQYAQGVHAHDEAKRLESEKKAAPSPAGTAAQTQRDGRPIYVVIAPVSKKANILSDHSARSTIIQKLRSGDRVFLEDGHVRNDDPPSPVTWQKVTTMNGATGWIDFVYLAPEPSSPLPLASVQPKAIVQQSSQPQITKARTLNIASITKEHPYVNSFGMKFAPVAGTRVLFSVWDTRVKDYKIFADATKHDWPKTDFKQTEEDPAVNVSWDDATAFCKWLTEKEQKAGLITATQSYQLPTDLEWSSAVGLEKESGSTPEQRDEKVKGVYPWGREWPPPKSAGNYDPSLNVDDYKYTSPVGSFEANQYGLYDMGGNVWQWCQDWRNVEKKHRVLRGASWNNREAEVLLSSSRGSVSSGFGNVDYGFRCVLSESEIASRKDEKSSAPLESLSPSASQLNQPVPTPTAAPSVNPWAQDGRTWQAWIGDFVKQFVAANQSKDVNATLALYAPTVDYFDDHQADQAFIRRDIEKYNERWPVRQDSIEGDIHLQEKVPDQQYLANFKLNFYAESTPRNIWTKGQFAIDLDITIVDGVPKISGIREKMVHQQKGKPGSTPSNNAPRKSYAYGIPIQGKAGFVRSPYAPSKGEIDIRRYPKGTQLKCPFTGKTFIAP